MKTLAIQNSTEIAVKFTLKEGSVQKLFAFSFTATRLDQDEIQERLEDKDRKVKSFMAEVITGWAGQRLVLEDNGQPADFSPEALEMLLNVMGVAVILFNAYLKDCGAKEKN
jgi:hypothetical protein